MKMMPRSSDWQAPPLMSFSEMFETTYVEAVREFAQERDADVCAALCAKGGCIRRERLFCCDVLNCCNEVVALTRHRL